MTTAAVAARQPQFDDTRRVGMARLVRVELRKILDTRAGLWLLIAIGAVTATALGIYLGVATHSQLTFDNALAVAGSPQTLILPVLGALSITSEWSQRTGLVSFTLEPSRLRVVLAKVFAMVIISLGVVATAYVFGALANELGIIIRGHGSWHYHISWVFDVALAQIITVLEGLGLGMLLMSSAAAIVVYYVARIVFPILLNVIPGIAGSQPWIDLNVSVGNLFGHQLDSQGWLQLLITVCIWLGIPFGIGFTRLLRSEVK